MTLSNESWRCRLGWHRMRWDMLCDVRCERCGKERPPDFYMPSAEGQFGYPADLLRMSKQELEALLADDALPGGRRDS